MDLIKEYGHIGNTYSKKIDIIRYTEGEKISVNNEGVKDICEIIIGNNEIEYDNIEKTCRNKFIVNRKLEIIQDAVYEQYSKNFNRILLENSFQNRNHLSSILYMNDYYKINCIIYNQNTNKYYPTSLKDYPPLVCMYKNNTWFLDSNNLHSDIMLTYDYDINDLSNIITVDCDLMIYKPYLKPITKYKLNELVEISISKGISLLESTGKKKLKKRLYDDINLHHIKQNY